MTESPLSPPPSTISPPPPVGSEPQLILVAVECDDEHNNNNNNGTTNVGLRKLRIHRNDILSTFSDNKSNTSNENEELFTERLIRRIILQRLEAIGNEGSTQQQQQDDEQETAGDDGVVVAVAANNRRVICSATVEFYNPQTSRFVAITDSSTDPVVNRFGTRIRCTVSHIRWSSSSSSSRCCSNNIQHDGTDDGGGGGGDSTTTEKKKKKNEASSELLAIVGRYFPYDAERGMVVAGKTLVVREIQNSHVDGTGLNVWDGAVLLTRYLEMFPEKIRCKSVLELGAGCGLVGIAAFTLGARTVTATDLDYALPLLIDNINRNNVNDNDDYDNDNDGEVSGKGKGKIVCRMCDWFAPPSLSAFDFPAPTLPPPPPTTTTTTTTSVVTTTTTTTTSFSSSSSTPSLTKTPYYPEVILAADCVWLEELVDPLLHTLGILSGPDTQVLISYQRRGKATHERFWNGLRRVFRTVTEVDLLGLGGGSGGSGSGSSGCEDRKSKIVELLKGDIPSVMFVLECHK